MAAADHPPARMLLGIPKTSLHRYLALEAAP
jgi:hypothetical protein